MLLSIHVFKVLEPPAQRISAPLGELKLSVRTWPSIAFVTQLGWGAGLNLIPADWKEGERQAAKALTHHRDLSFSTVPWASPIEQL